MPLKPFGPPWYGAAYYPEDWPVSQIAEDIALMQQAGMNVMRIGEFAWSRMEPEEGRFEWEWLHHVVDALAEAGIATIMGTPTPTPPMWLVERYPECLFVREDGTLAQHGGRRHHCPNSPVYRRHVERIVTALAREFGQDPHVIGWQIDNEVYPLHPSRACCCAVCKTRFSEYLRQTFGTIEALNAAWCTTLWSQEYQRFDQVPTPRPDTWHHPSLLLAWDRFTNASYVDYVEFQADILHAWVSQPVGTDMMMIPGIDHWQINRSLDVVQYNHYHFGAGLRDAAFWFDYLRPIKPDQPFWNTETATNWAGSTRTTGVSPEGFCRANSWMPIALGGEANLFWLWRQHRVGQELMHGAVVSSCGRPLHIFPEIQEVSDGLARAAEFLNGTRPESSGLALHYSNEAHLYLKNAPLSERTAHLERVMHSFYQPMIRAQYRPDVISPEADLGSYRLVFTPFLPWLGESRLDERIVDWVKRGGIWVAGPLTDIMDGQGSKWTHAPFGMLESLTSVRCVYQFPGDGGRSCTIHSCADTETTGSVWFDAFEADRAVELARYLDGPAAGYAAMVMAEYGEGAIVLLGSCLDEAGIIGLLRVTSEKARISPSAEATSSLLVAPRCGDAGRGLVAVEMDNQPAVLSLSEPGTDILTGAAVSGEVPVEPYGVRVIRFSL